MIEPRSGERPDTQISTSASEPLVRPPGTESREPEAGSREPRADSPTPEAESRKPGAESWEPEVESGELRSESRKPEAGIQRSRAASPEPEAGFYDIVTFRAVEKFDSILPLAHAFLAPNGILALLIGSGQLPSLQSLPDVSWNHSIDVPQSHERILATGRRSTR
jgi:hypothetical protein